jgi:hypothetical protein
MKRVRAKAALLGALALFGAAAPQAAPAQLFLYDPDFRAGPIEPNDPLVGIALPGATPAEYRASLIWNLRSGLNVAALQCQFSPYLRTVDNYNGILAHHSRELAAAYSALEGYFRRVGGARGPRRFDEYSTQTYNNFSTFHAQLGFCQTASRISKDALSRRQGEFGQLAAARLRELRNSLTPGFDSLAFTRMPVMVRPLTLGPAAPADCRGLPRRERRECERQLRAQRR